MFANWKYPRFLVFRGRYWPNTFHAHRLLLYAESQHFPRTTELINKLFLATYENGENISSIPTLVRLSDEVGLTGVLDMLQSTLYMEEVIKEDNYAKSDLDIEFAQRCGVTCSGVPYFIVNNRFYLEGANPSSSFINVFDVVERLQNDKEDNE